ncbi:MAG: hypothetical protein FJX25_04480 [Alphaproteobacteria bacterium]|nr:hypothetical protein [Alphaproteobacteria bacterium]
MNMNQLFNMFARLVMRRAMNWGINKGMKGMGGRNSGASMGQVPGSGKQNQDLAKRMRSLGRMMRR